jgi:DNA-binding NarL/FixJ family response regulator
MLPAYAPAEGPTILIVEDRSAMRIVLAEFLRECVPGCEVLEAADGAEAMELFDRHLPRLVLMDIGLPDANGIELTRRMKANRPETALIIVSYLNSAAHVEQARVAGAAGYVAKDRLLSDLVPAITSCIGWHSTSRGGSARETATRHG